jgi:hypothetical protein
VAGLSAAGALVFLVLAGLTRLLSWAAARPSLRVFGYSRLATALIVIAVLIGVIVLVLMYSV